MPIGIPGMEGQLLLSGARRLLTGIPSIATGAWVNALRVAITPASADAELFLRALAQASCAVTSSADRHIVIAIRRKVGTGSWTGLYGAGSFTVLETEYLKGANYWDWGIGTAALNACVKPATTDQVTFELGAFVIEGTSIVSNVNVHFNRPGAGGNNWFDNAERVTMLEVAQLAADGSVEETTVTARDS